MEFPDQLGLHFHTPGHGPMAWGRGPLGTNPALVLSTLRPKASQKCKSRAPWFCLSSKSVSPTTAALPVQWGYYKCRHGDYLCYNRSERELQLPTLWFSGAGKPMSALGNVLSHIITQLFHILSSNLQAADCKFCREEAGTMVSCFYVRSRVGGMLLGLLPL